MKSRSIIHKLVSLLVVLCLLSPAAFASGYTAETVSAVPVYSTPQNILEWLPAGISVAVEETSGAWAKISYGRVTGFAELSGLSYPHAMAGFAVRDTNIYEAPHEFSNRITVPRGFPLTVVGEVGQFYLVKNASGQRGYAIKADLSPTAPGGVNPFRTYDPCWEQSSCMLLLPAWTTLYESLQPGARSMQIAQATPCYVLSRSGNDYLVANAERSAAAWVHLADLLPQMLV